MGDEDVVVGVMRGDSGHNDGADVTITATMVLMRVMVVGMLTTSMMGDSGNLRWIASLPPPIHAGHAPALRTHLDSAPLRGCSRSQRK